MSEPVILFEDVIHHSGGGVLKRSVIYYYKNNKFYAQENWADMIDLTADLEYLSIILTGDEMTFEEFKDIYEKLKEEYCFDDLIDKTIREHQLKNLLN